MAQEQNEVPQSPPQPTIKIWEIIKGVAISICASGTMKTCSIAQDIYIATVDQKRINSEQTTVHASLQRQIFTQQKESDDTRERVVYIEAVLFDPNRKRPSEKRDN